MKRIFAIACLVLLSSLCKAQGDYMAEMEEYRASQNAEFRDSKTSPLSKKAMKAFKGHDFFEVDPEFRVEARFEPTPKSRPFQLGTSRGTSRLYRRIGILHFELKGKPYTLEAYMQVRSFMPKGQTEYVFLPVMDETTGKTTYEAGRYLHYEGVPEGDTWVIDFNKLYNPSCAYSDRYECPKVPEPNHLPIAVEAGVRGPEGK